jgi:hypothetical protein
MIHTRPNPCSSVFIRGFFYLLLCTPLALLAQPIPKLTAISPEWIQRGTTVEIVFTGENLGAVTGFIFSGDAGLSATNVPLPAPPQPAITIESVGGAITSAAPPPARDEKRLVAKVTATADAAFSAREVRVVSPGGVSNPLQLNAGQWPEVREKEPDNSIEQAQLITFPAAISGVISAASQVDYYRFKAAKGQELVFDVDAAVRGSALDSSLALLNAAGKELARNEDNNGLDSLLTFTVPEDGEYLVQLRDFRYQGGGNFTYRLYAGALPYVDMIFPFGGQRGKSVEIALTGRNLAGTTKMTLAVAPTAPLGRQEIRATTPNGYSNLVPFDVSDLPDLLETEPNNALDKANVVTVPVVINGRIGEPKDIDRFKFKSDKDQKLVCEVAASRFGSKLDALLILTDAGGAMLQQNDDANGADARLEFDAKKDVEYILALRDLTERGGERFGYRLSIRPPGGGGGAGPDFSAVFLPDTIRVNREGQTKLRCEVNRVGGFEGPVRFAFAELPAGVFAEPLVLSSTPSSGILLVSVLKDAPLGSFPVRLTASATIGGKTVTRSATPISGAAGVRQACLTVLDTTPFTLEATTLSAAAEQNQSATIEVMVQRRDGFTGEVKLNAEGFSAGRDPITKSFDVGEVTVKGTESIGKLTFKAKLDSEVGTRTAVIRGEATVNGQLVTQYSREIPITITQVPFIVSSTLSRLSITALPASSASAARETSTTIKVERRAGFAGEVALSLEGVPTNVVTTLANIPASASETTLKIEATEKSAIGTNFTITVVGAATFNDRNYKHKSGGVALVVSAPEMTEIATNAPPAAAGGTK